MVNYFKSLNPKCDSVSWLRNKYKFS